MNSIHADSTTRCRYDGYHFILHASSLITEYLPAGIAQAFRGPTGQIAIMHIMHGKPKKT